MTVGLMILRVVVGALFAGHGAQKLSGWFGGHGINGTAGFMESLGFTNGRAVHLRNGVWNQRRDRAPSGVRGGGRGPRLHRAGDVLR